MGSTQRRSLASLIEHEMAGTWMLGLAAVSAIVWASVSPQSYSRITNASLSLPSIPLPVIANIRDLITNGLMVVFFLAIGLEIGRERRDGTLQNLGQALAPLVGALGGMAGAALVYEIVCLGWGNAHSRQGWGIPMATDVAFTLGALSLVKRQSAPGLRTFLLTLAICDDIATVIVLALVSHHASSSTQLVAGVMTLGVSVVVIAASLLFRSQVLMVVATLILWWSFAHLGIEPPLAGIVTGAALALHRASTTTAENFERIIVPVSTWIVLPLFSLAALGINVTASTWRGAPVVLVAILLARLIGKPVGVISGATLSSRFGGPSAFRDFPKLQLIGAAMLCAIGFTVPLIFAESIFGLGSPSYAASQISLVMASLVALVLGIWLIWAGRRR
jgi:Na+:H+ antiporter, NhaA family